METTAKIRSWIKAFFNALNAPRELRRVRQELEEIKRVKEALDSRVLELAEESGRLRGELDAKTNEVERLNQGMAEKNHELPRLQREITSLRTNFEEKVYIEAERRIHLHLPEMIRDAKENLISQLSRTWEITCEKCHHRFPVTLRPEGVSMLLKDGHIFIECLNSECKDTFLIFQYPHRIELKLQTFVSTIMEERLKEVYPYQWKNEPESKEARVPLIS